MRLFYDRRSVTLKICRFYVIRKRRHRRKSRILQTKGYKIDNQSSEKFTNFSSRIIDL